MGKRKNVLLYGCCGQLRAYLVNGLFRVRQLLREEDRQLLAAYLDRVDVVQVHLDIFILVVRSQKWRGRLCKANLRALNLNKSVLLVRANQHLKLNLIGNLAVPLQLEERFQVFLNEGLGYAELAAVGQKELKELITDVLLHV